MDCQKFDHVVIDALYDELDELTYAALRRHVEACSRCGEVWNGLRATRDAVSLPIEEPSADLEQRILTAVSRAQERTPWHRKALRALAWAGSHAMRPQLAMAALFVLVIGSSLLLLRAKPGTVGISPVRVTEQGVPAPDEGEQSQAGAPMPAQAAAPVAAEAMATPTAAARADNEAAKEDGRVDADAVKALADARATRDRSGCDAAIAAYDGVGARFPGTPQALDAMWEGAQCQKSLGNTDKARELWLSLKSSDGYKQRADDALRETDGAAMNNANQAVASRAGAAATSTATPPVAAAPGGGATGNAAAAQDELAAKKAKAAPGGGPGRNVQAAPAPKREVSVDAAF